MALELKAGQSCGFLQEKPGLAGRVRAMGDRLPQSCPWFLVPKASFYVPGSWSLYQNLEKKPGL